MSVMLEHVTRTVDGIPTIRDVSDVPSSSQRSNERSWALPDRVKQK